MEARVTDQKDNSGGQLPEPSSGVEKAEVSPILVTEEVTPEPDRPEHSPVEAAAPAPATPRRRGPFLPILGGVIAAGIGFGTAQYVPEGWPLALRDSAQATAFDTRLAEAERALAALPAPVDAAPLRAGLQEQQDRIAALEAQNQALQAQVEDLLARPVALPGDGSGAGIDISALLTPLQQEIEQLKSGMAGASDTSALKAEIEALRSSTEAERAATEARATEIAREAEARAGATRAEAAALRLSTAIDTGTSLEAALQDLSAAGFTVPADLTGHAAGVRTLASLQAGFPEAARLGLAAAARPDEGAGFGERVSAFLFSQANVRSLHPQEGSSADAVLSRMEAALQAGDLPATLREADALPAEAATAMSDWLSAARARQSVATAAAALLTFAAN